MGVPVFLEMWISQKVKKQREDSFFFLACEDSEADSAIVIWSATTLKLSIIMFYLFSLCFSHCWSCQKELVMWGKQELTKLILTGMSKSY